MESIVTAARPLLAYFPLAVSRPHQRRVACGDSRLLYYYTIIVVSFPLPSTFLCMEMEMERYRNGVGHPSPHSSCETLPNLVLSFFVAKRTAPGALSKVRPFVMYVCMVITYSRVWINRVRLPTLLVVS